MPKQINEAGWLANVPYKPSPNYNARPNGTDIDLLVIHNISLPPGKFGGNYIEDLFLNRLVPDVHPYFRDIYQLRVSSHFLIRRCGETRQYVSVYDRAWHAGQSQWQGKSNCNNYSLGIELEGSDDQLFTPNQYAALATLTGLLVSNFPLITEERIVGHSDVAPGRKTDPGPEFDWARFRQLLIGTIPLGTDIRTQGARVRSDTER